ncbi:DUF1361 domain-containing protein [Aquihabitans sp. McL0605]|uniref:DUF1361 domain-containing protein n=1 Tax=Aquihabitans sp. McL0605 TaxID=3415671 RepID=UPI003CF5401A
MSYVHGLAGQVLEIARGNASWMTWNLMLASIPAGLALVLFWQSHRRTAGWWLGVGAFALFLPNAPYLLTDLIHLRSDAAAATSNGALMFGVLPMYAAFVLLGMGSYVLCTELIVREVTDVRPGVARVRVELPVHLLCSIGIVLGRINRLNSWDTITRPRGTVASVLEALTWRGTPFAIAIAFIAVLTSFTILRALIVAADSWGRDWMARVRGAHAAGDHTPIPI